MSALIRSALTANPVVADIDITDKASNFLWFVFAAMITGAIGLMVWGNTKPVGQRTFHQLSAAICGTASIAYFCMAADLGATAIAVEYIRGGYLGADYVAAGIANPTRSIWYARYIDWTITTPLLLLDLLLTTALPLSEIFTIIFADVVMIVTGLIGSLVKSQYKWGLFAMGCAAEAYITYALLFPARSSAYRLGDDFGAAYVKSAIILSSLWILYPIIWGLADGGNVISPDAEMIWYGCVDILAKPVFCFIHCRELAKCDYSRLGLSSGKFSSAIEDLNVNNNVIEKNHLAAQGVHAAEPVHAVEPVV